ncbi:MaoC/PaaZ C-terminal domain-containing protein [Anaeromyxobacter sp. Fw109-5]|uniref:MaoC/PaaZ C-terminal domain-containing protein n=1 Tax=Anaeromyxobacter sp. (strain Fw109-5) TaxID=404589 RepID=UPI000158A740|nr:MaoC/PaaZ C-terminal domain-containing protein [Anaeromyxobacter sp. Fw109-5]ABS24606.1 MaoC domain protein dehydratase [Anaeromyxobacter sp. Fw109-5]
MLTARQLYFEAVKVGDELPPLVKPPVDRLQIARYVGAAQDWNPLYIDEPYAKNSGFPSALAPGMIAMGFLGELVVDWVRGARLRRFSARFVKIVWPGDVLTVRGRVTDRRFEEGGRYAVDIEVWAENQRGELVVRGLTGFQLYYSAEDEARQRAGGAPLVVTKEEEEARLAKLSRAQPSRPAAPASRPLAPPRLPQPPAQPAQPAPAARTAPPAAARPQAASRPPAPAATAARAAPAAAPKPAPKAAPVGARPRPGTKPPAPATQTPKRAAARPRPAAKATAGKAKAARPRPAKRPAGKEKGANARARAHGAARKPTGKKRR